MSNLGLFRRDERIEWLSKRGLVQWVCNTIYADCISKRNSCLLGWNMDGSLE